MMNRSQIEKMLMASGGITGEPVQTARLGSYMTSTGGGKKSNTVTQRDTSGGGSTTQRKSIPNIKQGNAERQLNNLVINSRKNEGYRNFPNQYTPNEVSQNNFINLTPSQKKFVERNRRNDGSFNSAAQALINNSGKGFVVNNGKTVVDSVTSYQRDLQNFRTASPANEAAYVKRFPKTAAFQAMLAKGAEGIVGTPGRIIKKVADNYLDGVQNMIEKISGVDAKNVEIAKDKDTNISTIVDNLQRNITKEREDGKARGMTEADLTAMYGDPIDITTGDDIFGAELIGMDELEDDSPLNVAPTEGIAQSEAEQKKIEGGTQTQGLTPIRLDTFPGKDEDEGLFDLSGSDEPGQVSAFDLDPNKSYYDLESQTVITPDDIQRDREFAAREQFLRPFSSQIGMPADDFQTVLDDQYKARDEGFPDIDVTQEQPDISNLTNMRDELLQRGQDPNFYVNNPIEGQATAAGQGLVYADGSPIMEQGPTPLFDSDIDEEAIRRAIEGKAKGGQMFGNQNMSTFDKLKAIADGIADNK